MKYFIVIATFLAATTALADVPPPNSTQCNGTAGGACKTDDSKDGSCQKSTCSKLDYSHGTPPTSVDYDCVICVEGAVVAPVDSDTGTAASGGTKSTSSSSKCSVAPTGAPAAGWLMLLGIAFLVSRRRTVG